MKNMQDVVKTKRKEIMYYPSNLVFYGNYDGQYTFFITPISHHSIEALIYGGL